MEFTLYSLHVFYMDFFRLENNILRETWKGGEGDNQVYSKAGSGHCGPLWQGTKIQLPDAERSGTEEARDG